MKRFFRRQRTPKPHAVQDDDDDGFDGTGGVLSNSSSSSSMSRGMDNSGGTDDDNSKKGGNNRNNKKKDDTDEDDDDMDNPPEMSPYVDEELQEKAQEVMADNLEMMREIVMRLREDEDFAKNIYADCPRLQLLLEEHPDLRPIFEDPKLVRINFEKVYKDAGGVLPEDEKEPWFFMKWYNWVMEKVEIVTNHPLFRLFKFLMIIKRVLGLLSPTKGLGAIKAFFTAQFFENMEPPEAPDVDGDVNLENDQAKAQLHAAADHMEAPEVQEKMQSLLEGDPDQLEEEIENDKMLRDLRDSNELCAEMMQDPETMKILVDPENLRALGECPDLIEQDFADGGWGGAMEGGAMDGGGMDGGGMDGGGLDVNPEVEAQEDALLEDIPEEEAELEEVEGEGEDAEGEGQEEDAEEEQGDGEEDEEEEEEEEDGNAIEDVERQERSDPKAAKNQQKAQKQQQKQQQNMEEGEGMDKVAIAGMVGALGVGALGSLGLDFGGFGFGGGGEDLDLGLGGGEDVGLESAGDVGLEDPGLEGEIEDPTEAGVLVDEDVAEAEEDLLEDLEGEEEEEEEEGGFADNMQEEFEDLEGEEVEADAGKSKSKGQQQQQQRGSDPNDPNAPEGEKEGGGGIGAAIWGATIGAATATVVGAASAFIGDDEGYLETLQGATEDHQEEAEEEEEEEDEDGKKAKGGDGDADVADEKKKKKGIFGAAGSILSAAIQDHIASSALAEVLGDDAAEQWEDDMEAHEEEFEEEEEEEDDEEKEGSDDEEGGKKGGESDDDDDRKPAARETGEGGTRGTDDDPGADKPEEQKKRGAFSRFGRNK